MQMSCVADAARRALAQRAWRQRSSYDEAYQAFMRARGVQTHMEWFQSFVVRYMLARTTLLNGVPVPPNTLLAMSAGLGKTLIIIATVLAFGLRAVVVVPAALVSQWRSEIVTHTVLKDTHVVSLHGARARWPALHDTVRFVLVSYSTLSRATAAGSTFPWDAMHDFILVFDEVHYICNQTTQRFEAAMATVYNNGARRACIAMSGTPLKNSVSDLAAITRVLSSRYETGWLLGSVSWWRANALTPDVYATASIHEWREEYVLQCGQDVLLRKLPPLHSVSRVYDADEREHALCDALSAMVRTRRCGNTEERLVFQTFNRCNTLLTHPLAPRGRQCVRQVLAACNVEVPHMPASTCVRCHGARRRNEMRSAVNEGMSSDEEHAPSRARVNSCARGHPVCASCLTHVWIEGCATCIYEDAAVNVGMPLAYTSVEELINASSKFRELRAVLTDIPHDDTIIIFGSHISVLVLVQVLVNDVCPWRTCFQLNYTVRNRDECITNWKTTPRSVLISGTGVGGVGLTLVPLHSTGASCWVIFTQPSINLAAMDQARNRTFRLGQTRSVVVVNFAPRNTIQSHTGWLARNHMRIAREGSIALPLLHGPCMQPTTIQREDGADMMRDMCHMWSHKRTST
jgi:hypothetical protein